MAARSRRGGGSGGGGGAPYLEPTLFTRTPITAAPGDADTAVDVTGECFYQGATVLRANGTALATTVHDQRSLTAVLDAALLVSVGSLSLVAHNPGAGGDSNALTFNVAALQPVLESLSTPTRALFSEGVAQVITGQNFTPETAVLFDGDANPYGLELDVEYVSATELVVVVPDLLHMPKGDGSTTWAISAANGASVSEEALTYTLEAPSWMETFHLPAVARVTAPAGVLTRISDASGHGFHSDAAGAQRPTFYATGAALEDRPFVRYNGAANTTIALGIALFAPYERVAYIRPTTWVNPAFLFSGLGGGFRGVIYQGGETGCLSMSSGGYPFGRMLPAGEWALVRSQFSSAGKHSLNDDYELLLDTGTNGIDGGDAIGSSGGNSNYAAMDLGFSILANTTIPDADFSRIKKWCDLYFLGITDNTQDVRVACHGDSLTESGSGRESYPSQLGRILQSGKYGPAVVNAGVGGLGTGDMIANFNALVAPSYSAELRRWIYICMGGTNDLNASIPPATIFANYLTLNAMAKAMGPNVRTILVTEPPFQIPGDDEATINAKFAQLEILWGLIRADTAFDAIADLDALGDPYMTLASCLDTVGLTDRVHRTAVGYSAMATAIAPVVVAQAL